MRNYILLACLILFSSFSKAGLSVEPYLGYGIGYFSTQQSATYTGTTIGSRMGYSRWNLMLGADISYTKYTPFTSYEYSSTFTNSSQQTAPKGMNQLALFSQSQFNVQSSAMPYNAIHLGPSVVFGLPLIIDAYTSIIWSQASNSQATLQGAGIKVGASYLNLPFLSVNLELQAIRFFSCANKGNFTGCDGEDISPLVGTMYMATIYISSPINTGIL